MQDSLYSIEYIHIERYYVELIYSIVLGGDRIEDTKGCQNRAIHYARSDNVRFFVF